MGIEGGLELPQYLLGVFLDVVVLRSVGNDLPLEDSLDDLVIEALSVQIPVRLLQRLMERQQIVDHLGVLDLFGGLRA
jgi:hypothetical protein